MQIRVMLALLALSALAGCTKQPDPSAPATQTAIEAPPATQTVETETLEAAPASVAEPYRVVTDYVGNSRAEFTVIINGATVGSYNTDNVENDISSYLQPGQNTVKVAWTADPSMNSVEKARLKIQTKRGGSWNDVITREVRRGTAAGDSELEIQVGPPAPGQMPAVAQAPAAMPDAPAPATDAPAPATDAPAPAPNLSEKYIVKTKFSSLAPGEFNVTLNGESVGSYSANSNQDITPRLRQGLNRVIVKWAGKSRNRFSKSELTIGVNRGGKWSTVGNAVIDRDNLQGSKTFEFTAR